MFSVNRLSWSFLKKYASEGMCCSIGQSKKDEVEDASEPEAKQPKVAFKSAAKAVSSADQTVDYDKEDDFKLGA